MQIGRRMESTMADRASLWVKEALRRARAYRAQRMDGADWVDGRGGIAAIPAGLSGAAGIASSACICGKGNDKEAIKE